MTTQATQACKAFAKVLLAGIFALEAGRVSLWADVYRFKEVERNCILKTRLAKLLKSSDASTIQAAIDSLNAEVAMCLDQEMQAGDYHSMGIFVGEKQRTTQYFGGGHALIKISRISDWSFKALPGFEAHLRIVYWPAAPKQLQ